MKCSCSKNKKAFVQFIVPAYDEEPEMVKNLCKDCAIFWSLHALETIRSWSINSIKRL